MLLLEVRNHASSEASKAKWAGGEGVVWGPDRATSSWGLNYQVDLKSHRGTTGRLGKLATSSSLADGYSFVLGI